MVAHLTQGKLSHALLPLPLDQLEAKVNHLTAMVEKSSEKLGE